MLKSVVSGIALTTVVTLVSPSLALAQAQPQPFRAVEQPREWTVDIGGGMVHGFSPSGKSPDKTRFTPWASASWKGRVYANGLDGLGVNTVKRDGFNAGFQLRPRYSGQSDLEGLELPGRGVDLATYAYKRIGENTVIGGRIGSDISDESRGMDVFLSAARQDITRVGLLQSMNAERALGDVADSPLIERRRHGEMAYRGGIVVVRRFHSR